MREIELQDSSWISSVEVTFLSEGVEHGSMGVRIRLSGNPYPGKIELIAELIEKLQVTSLPKRRLIRFEGHLSSNDPGLLLLTKTLFDYGYELQCVIPNGMTYPWLQYMRWIIIDTSDTVVLGTCNELWYHPEKDFPQDVTIPTPPQLITFFLIKQGRHGYPVEELFNFMSRSRHHWRLM